MSWRKGYYHYDQAAHTIQFDSENLAESTADPHLRYIASYAASRNGYGSSCRSCQGPFDEGSLKLSVKIQSRTEDRKNTVPYHLKCFFDKQRVRSDADISGFENLRLADQHRIQKQIDRTNAKVVKPRNGKRSKDTSGTVKMSAKALRDYGVEYSKSSRATCCGCRQKILKNLVRCKKVIYDTEVGMCFGGQPLWHHLECFAKLQTDLGWYGVGDQLPGFKELLDKDQEAVRQAISPVALDDVPELKKAKKSTLTKAAKSAASLMDQQNLQFFDNRDFIQQKLQKSSWLQLLEVNRQEIPTSTNEILDAVADLLTFGALAKCPTCESGQMKLRKLGFGCNGNLSEWAKCDYVSSTPTRTMCVVPTWLAVHFSDRPAPEVQDRLFKAVEPEVGGTSSAVKTKDFYQPKVQREKPPLYMMEIVILGRLSRTRPELKKVVEQLGGKISTKLQGNTAVVVATQSIFEAMGEKILEAKSLGIQVVLEEFFTAVETGTKAVDYITKSSICDWGSDPTTRIDQNDVAVMKSGGMYTRAVPKKVKLKVINGTAVDVDSGLAESCHVFIHKDVKYTTTLNLVDIQAGKNSYFKLQVLEHDKNFANYYVFSSWGRIGTNIGSNDTQYFNDSAAAVAKFRSIYAQKTGNSFATHNPKKHPGLYYPVEVQFDDDNEVHQRPKVDVPSRLDVPVQELIRLIFDTSQMKRVMLDFDLDMEKMPLGKISTSQVMRAMTVLSEVTNLIRTKGRRADFIGASNHFYTLIPHNFGTQLPPIIDTLDVVNKKNDMLQSLLEIEVAHSLIHRSEATANTCQLDLQYDILKTDLERIEPDSPEYHWLAQYLRNTHATTHNNYQLEILDVFRVQRSGEQKRFEPFAQLPNRKLLWHGSRLTNYVGILSHGLRIAPPEAPPTGYMFGKGIYFADMVSKSANYCFTSQLNSTGLVMLCEVALGTAKECTAAENVTTLPPGYHSVKGTGQTYPDPAQSAFTPDFVEIPFGTPLVDLSVQSQLLYNEYIVYDVAQVKVKYLFKLKFKHEY